MRYVIGDIHGHAHALAAILDVIRPGATDQLIVMGDLIDHGPDSKAVLDQLIALQHTTQLSLLRGNHECLLLASRNDPAIEREWLRYGGDATLNSFQVKQARDIPDKYFAFIEQSIALLEMSDAIFVHAGLNPEKSIAEQSDDDLFWGHITKPIALASGKTLVTAHTPRALPYLSSHFIAIDTGIGQGGWLSCIALENPQAGPGQTIPENYLLANAQGEIRFGNIADLAAAA